MKVKGGVNYLIVKLEKEFEDSSGYKGIGGKDIILNTDNWASEDADNDKDQGGQAKKVRIYGEVVQVPLRLSRQPMLDWEPHGFPAYGPESVEYDFRTLQDIRQDVEVGDRVYFHFNAIMRRMYSPTGKITRKDRENFIEELKDGSVLYKINYSMVHCTVKPDGRIIPIGGKVLCEADKEDWDDILIKTYYDSARQKAKPRDQWIQIKVAPEARPLRAYVRYIGAPLKGEEDEVCGLKVGDKIIYKNNADWPVMIEGKEYYPIRHKHILAKIDE